MWWFTPAQKNQNQIWSTEFLWHFLPICSKASALDSSVSLWQGLSHEYRGGKITDNCFGWKWLFPSFSLSPCRLLQISVNAYLQSWPSNQTRAHDHIKLMPWTTWLQVEGNLAELASWAINTVLLLNIYWLFDVSVSAFWLDSKCFFFVFYRDKFISPLLIRQSHLKELHKMKHMPWKTFGCLYTSWLWSHLFAVHMEINIIVWLVSSDWQ